MEIEFNTSRLTKPSPGEPVARREPLTTMSNGTSMQITEALERKLNEIPLVRPEKVEAAKAAVASVKYPPDELMEGIANLLAKRLTE